MAEAYIAKRTFQNRKVRIVPVGAVQSDGKEMVDGWIRYNSVLDQWVMTKATADKLDLDKEYEIARTEPSRDETRAQDLSRDAP